LALAAVEKDAADAAAAKVVENAIDALPSANAVTVEDKTAIEAARAAYETLTDEQKAKVSASILESLANVETALAAAEKDAADTAAAKVVENAIDALPSAEAVIVEDKTTIEAARVAYETLTDGQKAKIDADVLAKLTNAETALAAAEKDAADSAAAKVAENAIVALPSANAVTIDDKTAIETARAAYEALTEAQKAKVSASVLESLANAETALAIAKKDAIDVAAAKVAENAIVALPSANAVTIDDKTAIETARAVYEALTEAQKAMVTSEILEILTKVENALAALSEKPTPVNNVKADTKQANVWYDLSGRRLQGKPTMPGLYINNNTKVIVK
jgi:hypothetical protein